MGKMPRHAESAPNIALLCTILTPAIVIPCNLTLTVASSRFNKRELPRTHYVMRSIVANPEAGTKRVCPETGKKFYDLNNDPIVSPYTGESYPLSFFEVEKAETAKKPAKEKPAEPSKEDDDDDELEDTGAEIVSLEEADAEVAGEGEDIPSLDGDDDDEITIEDDDDTFLETDDDENDDVSDLIVDADDGDKDV